MTYADRTEDTTTTAGTGSISLGGSAPAGRRSIEASFSVGDTIEYLVATADGTAWEINTGVLQEGGVLTRSTPQSSSAGGSLVDFAAGAKTVTHLVTASALNNLLANRPLAAATMSSGVVTSTMRVIVEDGGVLKRITLDNLLAQIGQTAAELTAAVTLSAPDIVAISQGGIEVRTTLAAIAAFIQSTLSIAPGSVTALAAPSTTSTTATLSWSPGVGGIPTAWAVTQRTPSGSGSYSASAGTFGMTGGTVTGLTSGNTYDFQVVPSNTYGAAPATTLTGVGISVSPPAAITSLAAGTVTSTTIPLTWAGGTGASSWAVQIKTPTGGGSYATPSFSVAPGSGGATISGLTAATSYDILVTATNSAGSVTSTLTNTVTAATSYTITGYSGNSVKATNDASVNYDSIFSGKRLLKAAHLMAGGANAPYWSIAPVPASAVGGWNNSPSTAPAEITSTQNTLGGGGLNGMVPLGKAAAFGWSGYMITIQGSGSGVSGDSSAKWYFWVKPVDGAAQCMNPSGLTLTNC